MGAKEILLLSILLSDFRDDDKNDRDDLVLVIVATSNKAFIIQQKEFNM